MSIEEHGLHVVLVEPEIHWNAGNAGRTCLAAGARLHLVRPLGFSLSDRRVRRAGLDYWKRVEPVIWSDFSEFEASLPGLGAPFFFCPGVPRYLWSVRFRKPTALIFGRESVGFSPDIRERYAEKLLSIPTIDPDLRSLNLSTCVAIAVYEVLRQWHTFVGS
jgi:tRNA (cytidine/uridine-2'-O-)-methyltransferase